MNWGLNGLFLTLVYFVIFMNFSGALILIPIFLVCTFALLGWGMNKTRQKTWLFLAAIAIVLCCVTLEHFYITLGFAAAGCLALLESLRLEALGYVASAKKSYFKTAQFLLLLSLMASVLSSLSLREQLLSLALLTSIFLGLLFFSVVYFVLGVNRLLRDVMSRNIATDEEM